MAFDAVRLRANVQKVAGKALDVAKRIPPSGIAGAVCVFGAAMGLGKVLTWIKAAEPSVFGKKLSPTEMHEVMLQHIPDQKERDEAYAAFNKLPRVYREKMLRARDLWPKGEVKEKAQADLLAFVHEVTGEDVKIPDGQRFGSEHWKKVFNAILLGGGYVETQPRWAAHLGSKGVSDGNFSWNSDLDSAEVKQRVAKNLGGYRVLRWSRKSEARKADLQRRAMAVEARTRLDALVAEELKYEDEKLRREGTFKSFLGLYTPGRKERVKRKISARSASRCMRATRYFGDAEALKTLHGAISAREGGRRVSRALKSAFTGALVIGGTGYLGSLLLGLI
jgi:hypothetical protein